MKPHLIRAILCMMLTLGATGCGLVSNRVEQESYASSSQQSATETMPDEAVTEPAILTPATTGDITDLAPSYEEIQEEAKRITSGNIEPTDQQRQELKEYYKSLQGKKIDGWLGWVSTVEPDREDYLSFSNPIDSSFPFEVWVRMYSSVDEPSDPPFSQVILIDVPLEQVEKLVAWATPVLDLSVPLQRVVFSGTLSDVDAPNLLYVKNARVQPAEQP